MINGKHLRMSRLFHPISQKAIFVPMDHGATLGPVEGLVDIGENISVLNQTASAIQAVIVHRGMMCCADEINSREPIISRVLHLSTSTKVSTTPNKKAITSSVDDALQIGADAVSIHVNLGVDGEDEMLADFGKVASDCQRWGMPLLAMMYVRKHAKTSCDPEDIKLAARVAAEIGADIVKVSYPGSAENMSEVTRGCPIPVLIAGGEPKANQDDISKMVRDAMSGGAGGICIGRNFFQNTDRTAFAARMEELVHGTNHTLLTGLQNGQPSQLNQRRDQ